jgi:RNA polymerase sigma-70 factor (ECF subfamily)
MQDLAADEDAQLVDRVKAGDRSGFELLMRRHNQRLFRAVRSVLRNDAEVEDVMQDAYCAAFVHLDQFQGRAKFSTWLLRIGVNEALGRLRRQRTIAIDDLSLVQGARVQNQSTPSETPEQQLSGREMVALVEKALDRLPIEYRSVFVLRVIESLDTAESADVLGLSEAAVKQRLHRAREMLQSHLATQLDAALPNTYAFLGARCDRLVANVMAKLAERPSP